MKIGILALQGDYLLHKNVLDRLDVESLYIRTANELSKCDSLIIPGGESTTMSILIQTFELYDSIRDFSLDHTVFGTCAGAILMSKSSKDSRVSNLNCIKTMGFRGEALSSIASVSDFSISSNQKNNSEGYEIKIVSGKVKHVKPINQKKGTCVKVRNLFFSTPARLKFLKSENYESILIKRLIQNFAIIHFDKEFNLYLNNKITIKTSLSKDREVKNRFFNRVNQVLGTDFVENSIDLEAHSEFISLSGLLGYPTFNYSNSNNQFVFVNGRVINDKTLNTIFRVAYKDVMFHDRFPQLILNIKCPHDWVDVNVHPMKNEVRFSDFNLLKSFIIKTFRDSFEKIGYENNKLKSSTPLVEENNVNGFQEKIKLKETNYSNYETNNNYDFGN